jgi:hypothetical protein
MLKLVVVVGELAAVVHWSMVSPGFFFLQGPPIKRSDLGTRGISSGGTQGITNLCLVVIVDDYSREANGSIRARVCWSYS